MPEAIVRKRQEAKKPEFEFADKKWSELSSNDKDKLIGNLAVLMGMVQPES